MAPVWQDPGGVPITAFLFGGRRATTVPLVYESHDWEHGVLVAATMASEKTAAATGGLGELRRDPFAMLPFCGYDMGSYFAHWLSMPDRTDRAVLPRIYGVNWFRKDADGRFVWPGFGENSRVLEWICRRLDGDAGGETTPIGVVPTAADLHTEGLDVAPDALAAALAVDPEEWLRELPGIREYFARFGERLPAELRTQLDALESRLS
jgi:phosphoenolpyruvate carboxykinase (GTP)